MSPAAVRVVPTVELDVGQRDVGRGPRAVGLVALAHAAHGFDVDRLRVEPAGLAGLGDVEPPVLAALDRVAHRVAVTEQNVAGGAHDYATEMDLTVCRNRLFFLQVEVLRKELSVRLSSARKQRPSNRGL